VVSQLNALLKALNLQERGEQFHDRSTNSIFRIDAETIPATKGSSGSSSGGAESVSQVRVVAGQCAKQQSGDQTEP
jgi:hypothetical protein